MNTHSVALLPLRYVADIRSSNVDKKSSDGETPVRLVNYTDVYYQAKITPDLDLMSATATPEQIERFRIAKGDTIITKDSETPDDIAVPAYVDEAASDMVCGYHLAIVRPTDAVVPKFLYWALKSEFMRKQFSSRANGMTRYGLSLEGLRGSEFPLPRVEEQQRIADFLDDQVTRIDQAIGQRKQQLSSVDARFDAKLKDLVLGRGDQDLGWADGIGGDRALLPLGRLMMLRGEKNDPVRLHQILSLTAKRGVIPYEEKGDIGNKASEDISRYSIVRIGDIVVNSMNVIIGSVGLSNYDGVLSPVYYVMKPVRNSRAIPEFVALHFRIRGFQQQLIKLGYGILEHRLRIPWINLKAELLAIPPLDVQREVVAELSSLDADRKNSLVTIRMGIDLLEERKRALITAAVTGQMDVTTAKPIGMGKWLPNVGANIEVSTVATTVSIGGI